MATPFVSSDLFEIKVKYVRVTLKSKLPAILVLKTEEQEKKYASKMQVLTTQWQQPNWREHNELHSDSMVTDSVTGVQRANYNLYRQLVLERFMKLWDVTEDRDGKPCPVELTPDNIHKLDPAIANALYEQWQSRVNADEEDVGN